MRPGTRDTLARIGVSVYVALGVSAVNFNFEPNFGLNYEGERHGVKFLGPVIEVDDHRVEIMPEEVLAAEGKAANRWAPNHEIRIYHDYGDACDTRLVGENYRRGGQLAEPSDIRPGDRIEVEGHLIEPAEACKSGTYQPPPYPPPYTPSPHHYSRY